MLVAEPFELDQVFYKLSGLRRVALAVSGGSDSMAMLRMVLEWAQNLDHSPQIFVATVDHGLRSAAAAEAVQVAQWCAALAITHTTLLWQHEGVKTGIQAKARQARYDLMAAWCAAHDVPVLLTAHTADDQAETVAMRKLRTASVNSIAGIWPAREWNGVQVLRPLLSLRRKALRAYLASIKQDWIDDPSNDDVQFERVRVRQELGGALHGLAAEADAAQAQVRDSQRVAQNWARQHFNVHETGFLTFDRTLFAALEDQVQELVVQQMLELCGSLPSRTELAERQNLLFWLAADGLGRKTLGGAVFVKRSKVIVVGREAGRISAELQILPESGQILWDGRFQVTGPPGAGVIRANILGSFPRNRDIPAFVQAGLPAITKNHKVLAVPHLGIGAGVSVKFLRH